LLFAAALVATSAVSARSAAALAASPAEAAPPPQRPSATPFLGMPPVSNLAAGGDLALVEVFPGISFQNPVFLIVEPDSNRFWVTEQQGRILSFENKPDVDHFRVVLDLRDVTLGQGDSGLLSMAFHPAFADDDSPSEGMIYAAYAHSEDDEDQPRHFRLSRFHVDRSTGIADPGSELVLIDQLDQQSWHQGGAIFFHPKDGYLYVTLGDEGGGRCQYGNCQRIDRDLFSGVLRIDVDNIGGTTSHAPPRQPNSGSTAHYSIPADNPFVGRVGVLEEFYALGLRSPHRMTYDPVDDLIWIGEVGQSQREEIDVLAAPAANFQWNIMEGTVPFDDTSVPPDPVIGTWTPPIHDYARTSGGTVIGGYVYRGLALPELKGRYIYGDFLSGRIWALDYEKVGDQVQFVGNEELMRTDFRGRDDGLVSFGTDADGELYVVTLGESAKLHKLVRAGSDPGNVPPTLSATGLFEDLPTLTPIPALVPYSVRVPLWSDGAAKRRWMSVPSGEVIDYSATAPWAFPPGSVFVKHFEIQTDDDDPESLRRLETRVLVVQPNREVYGVSYKWREDGSDADLVEAAVFEDLELTGPGGEPRVQRYLYPGPVDCLSCHDRGAGFVLGLRARQFDGVPDGPAGDQLEWLADAGFLDVDAAGLRRGSIPAFAPLEDEAASSELRVRSYLDVNCSHCHGAQDLDRSRWDARITTPLNRQRIVYGALLGDYNLEDASVVSPGHPETSLLFLRGASTDPALRMPPLARSVRDEAFLSVLEEWIESLPPTPLPPPVCGDSVAVFDVLNTADALGVLRAAVDLWQCESCICDVNDDAVISVADALRVLRRSIGLNPPLTCPACE